jgi:hypothetical protein
MMLTTETIMIRGFLVSMMLVVSVLALATAQNTGKTSGPADDPSGPYSFLREGEFVQLTLEDGKLSGYISRFGDTETDKDTFIDQFFDKASLEGDHLSFTTKTVHVTWYAFTGVITKTAGKQPSQEGYRVIKGTLVQHVTDANKVDKPRQRDVEFKSFPQEVSKP